MGAHAVTCCVLLALVLAVSCFPRHQDAMPAKLPARRSPRSTYAGAYRHVDLEHAFSAIFSEARHGVASSSSSSKASSLSLSFDHRYPSLSSFFSNEGMFDIHPYQRRKYIGHQSKPSSQRNKLYDGHDIAIKKTTEEHQHYPEKMFILGGYPTTTAYPVDDHRQYPTTTYTATSGSHYQTTSQQPTESRPQTTTPQPPKREPSDDYPVHPTIPAAVEFDDFEVFTDHPENKAPEEKTVDFKFPNEGYPDSLPENIEREPEYTITSYSADDGPGGGDQKASTLDQGTNLNLGEENFQKNFPTEESPSIDVEESKQNPDYTNTLYPSGGEIAVEEGTPASSMKGTNLDTEEDFHQSQPSTHVLEEGEVLISKGSTSQSSPEEEPDREFTKATWYPDYEEYYPSSGDVLSYE